MPTAYAGDPDLFPTSINLVSDGDPPDAATFGVPLEALADRTAFLRALVRTETETVIRAIPEIPYFEQEFFSYRQGGFQNRIVTKDDSDGKQIIWPLRLPHGARVDYCHVYIDPSGVHSSYPVEHPPTLSIMRSKFSDASEDVLATVTDLAINSSYETRHILQVSVDPGSPIVIDNSQWSYYLRYVNEAGVNSVANGNYVTMPPIVAFDTPDGWAGGY
ncbi:MAG TPA: hypothetical protein VK631_28975 [Solirubrobacteraceae bacterium]|nr:hypothetical protein [Solirubrobacteraceae bacterium]